MLKISKSDVRLSVLCEGDFHEACVLENTGFDKTRCACSCHGISYLEEASPSDRVEKIMYTIWATTNRFEVPRERFLVYVETLAGKYDLPEGVTPEIIVSEALKLEHSYWSLREVQERLSELFPSYHPR